MKDKRTAIYIRLSDEDNNVDGIIKAESNSVAAQRLLIRGTGIFRFLWMII